MIRHQQKHFLQAIKTHTSTSTSRVQTTKTVKDNMMDNIEIKSGALKKTVLALSLSVGVLSAPAFAQQITSYTYNTQGQVLTEDGPRTDVTDVMTYTYDTTGNRTSITNGLSQQTQLLDYNGRGQPGRIIDANGVETLLTYHVRGWLETVTVVDPAGIQNSVTQYTYDNVGQLTQVTLPNGTVLTYTYDGARRLTQISNSLGESITYTLDNAGNRTQEQITANGGAITYTVARTYDELSRVMDIIGAENQTTHLDYDVNGNNEAVTNPRAYVTDQVYDPLDRLVSQTEDAAGTNATTQFGYDDQDRLTSVTDANNNTTTYIYDAFDNLTQVHSPDTGTSTYTYDAANNRTSMTDNRGVVVNYTYDALNRLTLVEYPSAPAENVSYTYDSTVGGNYGIGRLTQITDQSGTTNYHYDYRGNLLSKTVSVNSQSYTTAYQYDLGNNPTAITYPSGMIVRYAYDTQGRVQSVTAEQPSQLPQTLVSNIDYLPFGPVSSMSYGNGLSSTMTYNQDYRLSGLTTGGILNLGYTYDANGNIRQIDHLHQPADNQVFGYDSLDRLLSSTGDYGVLGYTYDDVGNRLSRNQTAGADTQNDTYNYLLGSNQLGDIDNNTNGTLSQRTFTYDNNGNPVAINNSANGVSNLNSTYNAANRLAQVTTDSGTSDYVYNALGQRVTKSVPTVSQTFTLTTAPGTFSEPSYTAPANPTWAGLAQALYGTVDSNATQAVASQLQTTLTGLGYTLATITELELAELPTSYTVTVEPTPNTTDHLLVNTGAFISTVSSPITYDRQNVLETGGSGNAGEVTYRTLNGVVVNPDGSLTRTLADGFNDGNFDTNETLPANTDGWIEYTINATTQGDTNFGLATDSATGFSMPFRIWLEGGLVGAYEGFTWLSYSLIPYQVGDTVRIERNGTTVTYLHNGSVFYTSTQSSTESMRMGGMFYAMNSGISGVSASFGASGVISYYTVQANDNWDTIGSYVYGPGTADELEAALGSPALVVGQPITGFPATLTDDDATSSVPPYYPLPVSPTWSQLAGSFYNNTALAGELETAMGSPALVEGQPLLQSAFPDPLTVVEPWPSTNHNLNTAAFTRSEPNPTTFNLIDNNLSGGAGAGEVTYRTLNGVAVNADGSLTKTDPDAYGDGNFDTNETLPANTDGWIEFTINATTQDDTSFAFASDSATGYAAPYRIWLEGGLVGVYEGLDWRVHSPTPYQVGDTVRIERTGSTITYYHNGVLLYTSLQPSTEALRLDGIFYAMNSGISGIAASFGATGGPAYYTIQATDDWESIGTHLYGAGTGDELEAAFSPQVLVTGETLSGFPASLTDDEATTPVDPYYTLPVTPTWAALATLMYNDQTLAADLESAMGSPTLTGGQPLLESAFPNPLTISDAPAPVVTTYPVVTAVFSEPAYTVPASPSWSSLAQTLYGSSDAAGVLETTLSNAGYSLADSSILQNDLPDSLVSTASATTVYAYSEAGLLLGEYNEQGNVQVEYVWFNGQPLAQVRAGNAYTYHNDHLGTPRAMTDASQAVVWQAGYTPFGEAAIVTETVTNNLRFPGQYKDGETGLHYNWFRYYDPQTGRYITSDRIGLGDGPNTYAYVGANPLSYFDPNGLNKLGTLTGHGLGGAGAAGAASGAGCALCGGGSGGFNHSDPFSGPNGTSWSPSPSVPSLPWSMPSWSDLFPNPWGPFPKPEDEPAELPSPPPSHEECIEKCWRILEGPEEHPGQNTAKFNKCVDDCKRGKDCNL